MNEFFLYIFTKTRKRTNEIKINKKEENKILEKAKIKY